MNILIPDSWLRDYLKTDAKPADIQRCLSLCGPSIERIYGSGASTVYDVEITGNRPDMMSVVGVAREAATILPRFGIPASLVGDPYTEKISLPKPDKILPLTIRTDPTLNPRWMSLVLDAVSVSASPAWLRTYLELAGLRSINTVVDSTNFLMRAYGQPVHVFDYDKIGGHAMTLRASRTGETLVTLDGKRHTLPGGDIVIEDGAGNLIDLCGIMGGENSSVTEKTTRVILFVQTYNPSLIRQTSMALAHRTEAAGLFEKGLDTELVKPVLRKGARLIMELSGGKIASDITDIYPAPFKPYSVRTTVAKIHSYIGPLPAREIRSTLKSLGFAVTMAPDAVTVRVPSFRRDVTIDVDIIEEIARIYGYHAIAPVLPSAAPPMTLPDAQLHGEEEIKIRLRDWGYTEIYSYSMISEQLMHVFGLDTSRAYKITNPLSSEWVYMRPTLIPSMLSCIRENLKHTRDLSLFELSMEYTFRDHDLPDEQSVLLVAWTGHKFAQAKGLAESLFAMFGLPLPNPPKEEPKLHPWDNQCRLLLGTWGAVSEINRDLLSQLGISEPVTILWLRVSPLVAHARPTKTYIPIPKYPPIVEDLSFIVPERFAIGPLITALKSAHPLVVSVELMDVHKNSRTLHITYQDPQRNLTNEDIVPARKKLITVAKKTFGVTLKALEEGKEPGNPD